MKTLYLIYCLALEKVADIFDFPHDVISKVDFYHTTMSGNLKTLW